MRECCGGPLAVQVDMSVTRKYGGTGLGLSIVRQLVQAHEGEIHCRSKEGRGTAFTMKMPVMQSGRAIRHSLEAKVCVCVFVCVFVCVQERSMLGVLDRGALDPRSASCFHPTSAMPLGQACVLGAS